MGRQMGRCHLCDSQDLKDRLALLGLLDLPGPRDHKESKGEMGSREEKGNRDLEDLRDHRGSRDRKARREILDRRDRRDLRDYKGCRHREGVQRLWTSSLPLTSSLRPQVYKPLQAGQRSAAVTKHRLTLLERNQRGFE